MAGLNPLVPQVNDAELEADLSRLLTIVGPLGRLNVSDTVIPVVNLADLSPTPVAVQVPAYLPSEIFAGIALVAPLAGVELSTTGNLAAGVFDVIVNASCTDNAVNTAVQVLHLTSVFATRSRFDIPMTNGVAFTLTYATEVDLNDLIIVQMLGNAGAGELWGASIFAKRRT